MIVGAGPISPAYPTHRPRHYVGLSPGDRSERDHRRGPLPQAAHHLGDRRTHALTASTSCAARPQGGRPLRPDFCSGCRSTRCSSHQRSARTATKQVSSFSSRQAPHTRRAREPARTRREVALLVRANPDRTRRLGRGKHELWPHGRPSCLSRFREPSSAVTRIAEQRT
jgi:hypothetical protein